MGKQLKFWFVATLTTLMVLAGSILQIGEPLIASSGDVLPNHVIESANQLYTQYPHIPRSEQANTTLLSRFINYHLDTKARPGQYHLDWELSMADYLNARYSEDIDQSDMPTTDKLAMQTLSRQQRHELVHALENLFTQ